jgi:hypothetical protein
MSVANGWADVLGGIDAAAMDCVDVNLAVLADACHGPGTCLRLGSALRFSPKVRSDRLPTVEPGLEQRFSRAASLLGLVVKERWPGTAPGSLLALARENKPAALLVVGDAAALAWTPYYGRQSMDHTFLLAASAETSEFWLIDAYHNDTEWGRARPSTDCLSSGDLLQAIGAATFEVVRLEPTAVPAISTRAALAATREHFEAPFMEPARDAYVAAYRNGPQPGALAQLTLETWLLARERRLQAGWLAAAGPDVAPDALRSASEHASSWSGLAEHAYISLHRARLGRTVPAGLYDRLDDLLRRDTVLASQLTMAGS